MIMKRREPRSDRATIPYQHVGHKIRIKDDIVYKGRRIFRVPCARAGCADCRLISPSEYRRQKREDNEIYCSIACARHNPAWERTCYLCESEFYKPDSQLRGSPERPFCSKDCYTAWQKTAENAGENHPNYSGGRSGRDTTSQPYRQWRDAVFERDNYKCQLCGDRGIYLHAHHIIAFGLRPDLELELSNGIALCTECHKEVHRETGKLCDSRAYLIEYGALRSSVRAA